MALDAFSCRLGIGQGRIGIGAPSSSHAFVLGDLEPGRLFNLAPGDYAEVSQEADLTGAVLLRATFRLRTPVSLPPELTWEVSLMVDGVKQARIVGRPGRERVVTDLAANVSKLSGPHTVGVRLELVPR